MPTSDTVVVRGVDGVRFSAPADRDEDATRLLIGYIRERCHDVLWPAAAREVQALIDAHQDADAIASYFANVGQRWDEEWLEPRYPAEPRTARTANTGTILPFAAA